jgi:hypothetical protein
MFISYLIECMQLMVSPIWLVYFAVETETKGIGRGHEAVHSCTLSNWRLDESMLSEERSHVIESGLVNRTVLTSRCSQPPPPSQLRMNAVLLALVTPVACAPGAPSLLSDPCRESFSVAAAEL